MTHAPRTESTDGRSRGGRDGRGGRGGLPRARAAALRHLLALFAAREYEEAEAAARTLAARRRHVWERGPELRSPARVAALAAATMQGRGKYALAELDSLEAEFRQSNRVDRTVLLLLRICRTAALVGEEQYAETESEASGILREVTRLAHMVDVADAEFFALTHLTRALCGQGRFEEAETIARGNLAGAAGEAAAIWRCLLMRCLNGQHRYEEALAESRQLPPLGPAPPPSPVARSGERALVTAAALYGAGRLHDAELITRQGLSSSGQFPHPHHQVVRELGELLCRITTDGSAPGDDPAQGGGSP